MSNDHSLRVLLHALTHRIPGVPAHADLPAGHHGRTRHGHTPRRSATPNHSLNHSPARPPRRLVAWQGRIAAFFSRQL